MYASMIADTASQEQLIRQVPVNLQNRMHPFGLYTSVGSGKGSMPDCLDPGHNRCYLEKLDQSIRKPAQSRQAPYIKPTLKTGCRDKDKYCWGHNSGQGCEFEAEGRPCSFRHICACCKQDCHPLDKCPKGCPRTTSNAKLPDLARIRDVNSIATGCSYTDS